MPHHKHILRYLSQRLVNLYCPQGKAIRLSKWDCRDHLMAAIARHWNLPYHQLPCEETFYHALRGHRCSSAMKEKLALFYYAKAQPEKAKDLIQRYLEIAHRQRLNVTVYWNLLVQQYRDEHPAKPNSSQLPKQLARWLKNLSNNDWKKLEQAMKRGRGK